MCTVCLASCVTGDGAPLRRESDSLSKPAGRGPDEKRDRTEASRGGVGERKPGPSYTTLSLQHSASAKTLM